MEAIADTIDYKLADNLPQKRYAPLHLQEPMLFAGYIIKNEYDEQRFQIADNLQATRFSFQTLNQCYNMYGITRKSSAQFLQLLQHKQIDNLIDYNSFLTLHGLSCLTCFLHFTPGLYPLDNHYLHEYFSDVDFNHFNKKNNISPFQKVAHIYFFALVNCTK